jgi:hypothetical protein
MYGELLCPQRPVRLCANRHPRSFTCNPLHPPQLLLLLRAQSLTRACSRVRCRHGNRSPGVLVSFPSLSPRQVRQRLARAHGGAHRLQAHSSAVITHIALHHQLDIGVYLRYSERKRQHTTGTRDAAGLQRTPDHTIFTFSNRISGTDHGARWLVAVHADHRNGCDRVGT